MAQTSKTAGQTAQAVTLTAEEFAEFQRLRELERVEHECSEALKAEVKAKSAKSKTQSNQDKIREAYFSQTQAHIFDDGVTKAWEGSMTLDVGKKISPNYKMTNNARKLMAHMLKQGVGYKCGYLKLKRELFPKWEGTHYKTSDKLTDNDIASAIKGMYLGVTDGSMKFVDGSKLMLKEILQPNDDGSFSQVLKLTEYVDGLFEIADTKRTTKSAEVNVKETLETLLKGKVTDNERRILQYALKELSK